MGKNRIVMIGSIGTFLILFGWTFFFINKKEVGISVEMLTEALDSDMSPQSEMFEETSFEQVRQRFRQLVQQWNKFPGERIPHKFIGFVLISSGMSTPFIMGGFNETTMTIVSQYPFTDTISCMSLPVDDTFMSWVKAFKSDSSWSNQTFRFSEGAVYVFFFISIGGSMKSGYRLYDGYVDNQAERSEQAFNNLIEYFLSKTSAIPTWIIR